MDAAWNLMKEKGMPTSLQEFDEETISIDMLIGKTERNRPLIDQIGFREFIAFLKEHFPVEQPELQRLLAISDELGLRECMRYCWDQPIIPGTARKGVKSGLNWQHIGNKNIV
jgi:hypothetical protein